MPLFTSFKCKLLLGYWNMRYIIVYEIFVSVYEFNNLIMDVNLINDMNIEFVLWKQIIDLRFIATKPTKSLNFLGLHILLKNEKKKKTQPISINKHLHCFSCNFPFYYRIEGQL